MTRRRTRLTLSLASCSALGAMAVLSGCGEEQAAPAPTDAIEQAQQRAMQENQGQDLVQQMVNNAPQLTDEEIEEARERMGLNEPAEPTEVVNVPAPSVDTELLTDEALDIGGVALGIPAGWVPMPASSSMRAAQYNVGDSGQVVVFRGIGGGVDANIERWIGQVGSPVSPAERSSFEAGGVTVHTVELTGAYTGMNMQGSTPTQENTTFFGAIIEGASTPIQIRLTIDADEADAAREQWNAFLTSVAPAP